MLPLVVLAHRGRRAGRCSLPRSPPRVRAQAAVWRSVGSARRSACCSWSPPRGRVQGPAGQALASCRPARPPTCIRLARGEVQGQPELAAWIPSHLCFYAVDTIRTTELHRSRDRKAASPDLRPLDGARRRARRAKRGRGALLFASNGRLISPGDKAGQFAGGAESARCREDKNGVPSSDDRFQVKIGKTLITWDGHRASDSAADGSVRSAGRPRGSAQVVYGEHLTPDAVSSPMVGSLKVEGKDDSPKRSGRRRASWGRYTRVGRGEIRAPKVSNADSTGSRRTLCRKCMSKMFIIRSSE